MPGWAPDNCNLTAFTMQEHHQPSCLMTRKGVASLPTLMGTTGNRNCNKK